MFSFKDSHEALPIAIEDKTGKIIYFNPNGVGNEILNTTNEIHPLPTQIRQVIYIAGSAGSGKSYQVASLINNFLKLFPKRRVFVISCHEYDETFDLFDMPIEENILRIQPSIDMIEQRIGRKDFANSLVIFDDISNSQLSDNPIAKENTKENKFIKEYLENLIIDLVQNGRHDNINVLITAHQLYDRKGNTSTLLNDCTDYIVFPISTGNNHMEYFLTNYIGLNAHDKKNFKEVIRRSRWVLIHKNPKYIIWDKGATLY
jgi:hypothetical protein